ncbi:MAG: flagellar basal body-associated protein FliL, partial [Burkholderiaceae bacterium]
PLDNMVVNLADPGGDRFAQIGITLELSDAKASDQVKQYLPTIRNAILMLISQRSSEDLLRREGKEALAEDIRREVSRPLGYAVPEKGASTARDGHGSADNPVRRVLFSSFIIQ